MSELVIPPNLRPRDGRFGSGPSKIRPQALEALGRRDDIMGTSHRHAPVRAVVQHVQELLSHLYALPEGYQVVMGIGGATQFWDIATCCLIDHRSAHGVFGEFSGKFAKAVAAAPFLENPVLFEAPRGVRAIPQATPGCDVYAWPHNETSTGVCAPVVRPEGADEGALVLIDATSAAGGMHVDIAQADAYYFSPQKNFASDGGLWVALCSPAALDRSARITASGRWVPPTLNLTQAASNSAQHQTYNTPALATLLLLESQLVWLLDNGGLDFAARRTQASSGLLYEWAEASNGLATPFVDDPGARSPVVVTLEFDPARVDAAQLCATMRANGIVDIEPYRGVGRNQIRVGCFVSVDPDDIRALLASLNWLVERIAL